MAATAAQRARKWYLKNKARRAKWYADNKIAIRAARKEYRDSNKEKISEQNKLWRETNVVKLKGMKARYSRTHKREIFEHNVAYYNTHEGRAVHLLNAARNRAKRKGLEFSLTLADILPFPERCPVLGVVFDFKCTGARKGPQDLSPSIDRKNNAYGYVPGNIRIISWRANKLKSDATAEELRKVAEDLTQLERSSELRVVRNGTS